MIGATGQLGSLAADGGAGHARLADWAAYWAFSPESPRELMAGLLTSLSAVNGRYGAIDSLSYSEHLRPLSDVRTLQRHMYNKMLRPDALSWAIIPPGLLHFQALSPSTATRNCGIRRQRTRFKRITGLVNQLSDSIRRLRRKRQKMTGWRMKFKSFCRRSDRLV